MDFAGSSFKQQAEALTGMTTADMEYPSPLYFAKFAFSEIAFPVNPATKRAAIVSPPGLPQVQI